MTNLRLSDIRLDGGTQPRTTLHLPTISEYAEALRNGAVFPPVLVYYDGRDYWLADGFHRVAAHDEAGLETIAVDIRQGTQRDAILHSVGTNAIHGLRRTNADKRQAIMRLLDDDEWSHWSDREIARRCSVHHDTVATVRQEMAEERAAQNGLSGGNRQMRRTVERQGTRYQQDTAGINADRPTPLPPRQERDRVAPRSRPGIVASFEPDPDNAPEYSDQSRHSAYGEPIAPRPAGAVAEQFVLARKAALLLPPKAADALPHIPRDFEPEHAYEIADWWSDLGEAIEQQRNSSAA